MSETTQTVLLVGHCGPDAHMLTAAVRRAVPGVDVQIANDPRRLDAMLPAASLLLVNRLLDEDLGGDGVGLIRSLSQQERPGPPAMLISNYDDAQQQAEAAGALPGFGKASVMSDETRRRIRAALGLEE